MPTVYLAQDHSPLPLHELDGVTFVVTVPAAYSDTCTQQCVPSVLGHCEAIKDAGAHRIVVVSPDQPFAINSWVEASEFDSDHVEFASDYGNSEMQQEVGALKDEEGKEALPPLLAELLRRSYSVYKNGDVIWRYTEPDTTQYTLTLDELLNALRSA